MACGAENDQIADVIICALAINMADLQDIGDAEAAMRSDRRIMLERELSIVYAGHVEQRFRLRNLNRRIQPI